jgi:hypothetical protein
MDLHPYHHGKSRAERIAFAKSYPFERPAGSYLFVNGESHPYAEVRADDLRGAWLEKPTCLSAVSEALTPAQLETLRPDAPRVAVLAAGSNAAPGQLARKYRNFAGEAVIPVLSGWVEGLASVYVAALSPYGAVPAMLHRAQAMRARLFVTLLDEPTLRRMHETEEEGVAYHFRRLDGLAMMLDGGGTLDAVYAYIGDNGPMGHEGAPLALDAVAHEGDALPRLTEEEALDLVRRKLGVADPLDDFIDQNIIDAAARATRNRLLRAGHALAVAPGAADG